MTVAQIAKAIEYQTERTETALHRMEEKGWLDADWGYTERNRKAKFYRLTSLGRKQLAAELTRWSRYTNVVGLVLAADGVGSARA